MAEHTSETFAERLERAGHKLRRNEDGEVDNFVVSEGFHNGPGCLVCSESWCEHCACNREIEPCDGGAWHSEWEFKRDRDEWARLVAKYGATGPARTSTDGGRDG